MVIHENQGKFYYDHELEEIENAEFQSGLPMSTSGVGSESASVLTVTQDALFTSGFNKNAANNLRLSIDADRNP